MDLKEGEEINKIPAKPSVDENVLVQDIRQDDVLLSPIVNNPYLPLSDINNTREQISSLEQAQKKWIESSKSWPVKDELQNAQLQWLKEFSSGAKFLCTSTPQTIRKNARRSLPWSPPKNSTDVGSRRSAVVYRPGTTKFTNVETGSFLNEKGSIVKVVKLEEPTNATPVKRVQEEKSKHKLFSQLPDAEPREVKKSPTRQRYITVRRKLERLKNLATEGERDGEKSTNPVQDNKSAEKREAARQYILRKRAERERELEIQRRKEVKAEAERRARLERLRETQQRLIKHALKRQTPEKKPVSREEPEESDEGCVPLWKVSPQVNEQVEPRKSLELPRQSPTSSSVAVTGEEPEVVKNDGENKALDDPHIADLFLDRNIPTAKKMALLDRLEEGALTGKDSLSDILASQEYLSVVGSSPTKYPKPLTNVSPSPSSSSSLRLSRLDNKCSIRNSSAPENSTSSLASSSKESINVLNLLRQNEILAQENLSLNSCGPYLSEMHHPTSQGMERSYNILRAVSNKRAAFEHFNKDYMVNKNTDPSVKLSTSRNRLTNELELLNVQDRRKVSSDKGIQCHVEDSLKAPSSTSSNEQISTSSIYYSQSERLTKPDAVLFSGRTSDSCLYKHSKSFVSELPASHALLKNVEEDIIGLHTNAGTNQHLDSERDIDVLPDSQPLKDVISPNAKGRPLAGSLSHDPLSLPEDRFLSTIVQKNCNRKSPVESTQLEQNSNVFPLYKRSSASTFVLNTDFLSIQRKEIDDNKSEKSTVQAAGSSLSQAKQISDGDSRIQEEIRKLEAYNETISSVIEKNKSFFSESDANTKAGPYDPGILEHTMTSSTVNNDLLPNQSQESVNLRRSQSSSSNDVPSEEVSGTSILKFSLNMFNELLKDEDSRSAHQSSLFKMKEKALTEKIKAEIGFLEVEKKKLKESGNEDGVRNCRKKIRGLIIKLEHDLEELHRLRKNEKFEHKKRRQKLVEKINMIKIQLKMQQPENLKGTGTKEAAKKPLTSSQEMKKCHVSDRRGSDVRVALLEKKRKELEHRETVIAERLAELENISTWKQRLEEGEKRIQELEARLKMTSAPCISKESGGSACVDRGTSPFRLISDENHCEAQKAEGSYSDTFDQASSSSTHEKLEEKDARKMMAIKVPLSPLVCLKRRHSSGSDESLLQSQTETQSEASDMEIRVLALQQQLKQRKAKLESLHREYKKSQKERLIAKEQSLLSQIQAYDMYIDQVKKELDKEQDVSNIKFVKPLIKQPKTYSDRRKSDTWLVQDRKGRDGPSKDSLKNSSFLGGSAEFISKVPKDNDNENNLVKREHLKLDSSNLEKFSLKTKLILKTSHSDPNLLNSSDERIVESKISHSSTESCESDIDKIKLPQREINEREKNLQLSQRHFDREADALVGFYPAGLVEIKEGKNGAARETDNDSVQKKYAHEERVYEESEENSSTQASIVSKIVDENNLVPNVGDLSDKILSESVSDKNLSVEEIDGFTNQAGTIGSEAEETIQSHNRNGGENDKSGKLSLLVPESDNNLPSALAINTDGTLKSGSDIEVIYYSDVSEKLSEAKTANESVSQTEIVTEMLSHSDVAGEGKTESETIVSERVAETDLVSIDGSRLGIVSEEFLITEKISDSVSESVLPEVISARTFTDPENVENSIVISNEVSVKDASLVISEDIKSIVSANDSSDGLTLAKQCTGINSSEDTIEVEEKEEKSEKLEESLKEVTYLEVSDHIYPESISEEHSDGDANEGSSRVHSELSGIKHTEPKSLAEELEEVLDEETLKDHNVGVALSDPQDDDKSTFHSASDDLLSRVISEDISDGSFPLPITKDDNQKLSEEKEAIEQIVSDVSTDIPTEVGDIKESIDEVLPSNESNQSQSIASQEVENSVSVDEQFSPSNVSSVADNFSKTSPPNSAVSLKSVGSATSSLRQGNQSSIPTESNLEEKVDQKEVELKSDNVDLSYSHESEQITENVEEDKSFSESEVLHDSDVKSPLEEQTFEDSLDENSAPLTSLKLKSKLFEGQEEYESVSDASDSFIEDKYSEEDVYIMTGQLSDQQSTISKSSCAPLIDALQREGESALDVVWRSIAESAVEEGKELVISTFLRRLQFNPFLKTSKLTESQLQEKEVGDNEEEDWNKEKLPRDQAEEAEVLRLQQLKIDKEIEELEEEEARQYYYVRPIPDKPPPPYTPRRSCLVASVVEAAGELWAGRTEAPPSFMAGSQLREFIWDLAAELVLRARPLQPSPCPPWLKGRRPRPRKPIRTREELLAEVEKEAKVYLGVEERDVRENLIIRWSRKRRDHVDEILVRESGEEEWEWTDFTEEENMVKNRIAEALIEESLAEATAALASAFQRKFDQ